MTLQKDHPYRVWGPSNGSSAITVTYVSMHNRIVIDATTDFGEARCAFNRKHVEELRDVLNIMLEQTS